MLLNTRIKLENRPRCLSCDSFYTPTKDCLAAEYPYCTSCNLKQTKKLIKLQEKRIDPYYKKIRKQKRRDVNVQENDKCSEEKKESNQKV